MSDFVSIRGPVELIEGELVLRIPLAAGGEQLVECSRGIGEVQGEYLVVIIQSWLAEKLKIYEGAIVSIDNENGKFNIRPMPWQAN